VTEARAETLRGELVLRRRADGALELRVNGVFVMDTVETSSERALAAAGLETVDDPRRVLIAGLGLGFTLRAVLENPRVEQVTVVELEPALVDWLRTDVVPGGSALLADPRVTVLVDDIAGAVTGPAGAIEGADGYDVVLLDVDNGPDHMVHDTNALLYDRPFLRRCAGLLADDGVLVFWSMSHSPALLDALGAVFGRSWAQPCPVRLGERAETYWLHLAGAAGLGPSH
jgi:spermidine synthase